VRTQVKGQPKAVNPTAALGAGREKNEGKRVGHLQDSHNKGKSGKENSNGGVAPPITVQQAAENRTRKTRDFSTALCIRGAAEKSGKRNHSGNWGENEKITQMFINGQEVKKGKRTISLRLVGKGRKNLPLRWGKERSLFQPDRDMRLANTKDYRE